MARSATLDMTQGSLGRQIIGFSLPLMFTNLLQMLFSMVDLAVVGRFSSSAAMGSVGSTTTLIFLFTGFLMGLGSGVNVLVATHFGARSEKNVRESVHTSFLVCLIAGFLMLALGLIFARPLLELLNTRDDLIDGAELYLRIYFLGMPAAALYNYGNGVLNAIGDTKTPLIFLSAAGVLNVILDLVFVIGLGMSTDGVALASMLSQCVSAGLIVRSLMRSKEIYSLSLKEVRFHKDKAIHALSVGVPRAHLGHVLLVPDLGHDGLHYRRLARPWKGPRADDLRVLRLVRVPRGVDLHRVRPLPYDPLALYALSVLVGTHGRGGDRILFVLL